MLSHRTSAFLVFLLTLVLTLTVPLAVAQSGTPPAASPANASAQQPAAEPELTTSEEVQTFQVKVNLVEVRAVVRDAQGNAVGNLKQEDFLLFDDKKPQTITKFSVEHLGGDAPVAVAAGPNAQDTQSSDDNLKMRAPVHRVAYLFDDINSTANE